MRQEQDGLEQSLPLLGLEYSTVTCTFGSSKCTAKSHPLRSRGRIRWRHLPTSGSHIVGCSMWSQRCSYPAYYQQPERGKRSRYIGNSCGNSGIYAASGKSKQDFSISPDKKAPLVEGKIFDIVKDIGEVCLDPDIACENPLESNRQLATWVDLAQQCFPYPSGGKLFDAFWHTLVAGQDGEGWKISPPSFYEDIQFAVG